MQGYRDKQQRKALYLKALRGKAEQQSNSTVRSTFELRSFSRATELCEALFSRGALAEQPNYAEHCSVAAL